MKLISTLVMCVCLVQATAAQERSISGRLTSSEDRSPLPGVSIHIKGTSIGTVTDADGKYSINVPIGATLVFSFVGMQTHEVVVTERNLQPATGRRAETINRRKSDPLPPIPRSLYKDSTVETGVGFVIISPATPTYKAKARVDPNAIRSIKWRGNSYEIKSDYDPLRRTGFSLQFSTSFGMEKVTQLPSFQRVFAQGRTNGNSLQWRGADQQEIFSWGPLVRTLEFDGNNYAFDKNGSLVQSGSGNGNVAKNYSPFSFFKTGLTNVNEIMLALPTARHGTVIFNVEQRTRTGVIPNSRYAKLNMGASLKNYKLAEYLTGNASLSFNRSTGHLLNRGANLATIIGSVYRTPVTFDNSNALSRRAAATSSEAYNLPDGSIRSHAPGSVDNPFGLAGELPDYEQLRRILGTVHLESYMDNRFSFVFNGSVDQQWNETVSGLPPGYAGSTIGRITDRNENQTFASGILTSAYQSNGYSGNLKVSASYQTTYAARDLSRKDGFGFDPDKSFGRVEDMDSIFSRSKTVGRRIHELIFKTHFEYQEWLNASLANRSYFSSTISNNHYTNLFPSASVSADMADLIGLSPFDDVKLYASISRNISEAPLLYSTWSYASTTLPLENYAGFYEATELSGANGIAPETERKFESGMKINANRVRVQLSYYNNVTSDFIAPVASGEGFELRNAGQIKNFGGLVTAGFMGYLRDGSWGVDLTWSKSSNRVQKINSTEDWISLAGFETVQTVLAPGRPVAVIYGTTYLRNEQGKKVIGSDGFPLEDNNLKMIGNPMPDWNLGWSAYMTWKPLKLSFLFDFKHGGQVWNGTHSVLDYLGRSSSSGSERNTANYVFEGLDENGNINALPVNFYDPSQPIENNRWVRYGWDGVGEDYIEDASSIRLSELILSYSASRYSRKSAVKDLKVSLIGRNLFLITPYSGVDPSASLFGYASANGLDLFNMPSTRSYTIQLTIKI